ncbi:hypothetical protein L1987_15571 [Smallanthus sonchifolius]|uniref:Uncharacterized protein n=1 Tax=Smallanthus sonchifolius TaxID=185202 RepID=A0ACB9J5Z5_9ASTR|nr:hypothetical protein L1987_15571 [Smallanthus sonchifolius]
MVAGRRGEGEGRNNDGGWDLRNKREYVLLLPSGVELVLNNICYIPSLTRNIISVFALREQGFKYSFDGDFVNAYLNDLFYFTPKPHNGIYEIVVHDNNALYSISSKRTQLDLKNTYIWPCRPGHINKNRTKKLQTARILNSTGQESFDDCESCLSDKLTEAPFTGVGQRAKDLLGLVRTDVRGQFRTMSRSGERYFVTFTDDFSRYGYVYLMKHKHETFEMFKQFQNKVQNQLGKMIKMLRSDRELPSWRRNYLHEGLQKTCGSG